MIYFGYCTLLDKEKMKEFCPTAVGLEIAQLSGYKMCFSKFHDSNTEGSCDLEKLPGNKVWGLRYEISSEEYDALDILAGVDKGHLKRIEIEVTDKDGITLPATTYINPNPGGPFRPTPEYTKPIMVGAKALKLPQEYITELETIIKSAQQS